MCGIAGWLGNYEKERFARSVSLIRHRGPDHLGFYTDERVALGHARLSIIDLNERSHQPMLTDDGDLCLVFNGEIYNHQAIRKDLESQFAFRTSSDTEAILHAYQAYGVQCLDHLEGMFAFALWDRRKKMLFLARDRFGKKPLYYTVQNDELIFASEIKVILSLLDSRPGINQKAFIDYLQYLAPLPPDTFFKGIYKLEAGHYLLFDENGVKEGAYYSLLENINHADSRDAETAVEEIGSLLSHSVAQRMVADVDVTTFLSGGLDSSLISSLAKDFKRDGLHTFSVGYQQHTQYDELDYARLVSESLGLIYHELRTGSDDFINVLNEVIAAHDEPLNDPACLPTYLLSRFIHDNGIKVILSGEGSDELFLGYDSYFKIANALSMNQAINISGDVLPLFNSPNRLLIRDEIHEARRQRGQVIYRTIGETFTRDQVSQLLAPSSELQELAKEDDYIDRQWKEFSRHGNTDPCLWMSYIDMKVWIAEVLLMKVDKMSMAHSLEVRSPFLDRHLVESALSLSPGVRKGGESKWLLKKIAHNRLPEKIIRRKKKGFSSPYFEWYTSAKGNEILRDWRTVNHELGWFEDSFLLRLFEEGKRMRSKQHSWALVLFCQWFNRMMK